MVSGGIASGKTTVARGLSKALDAPVVPVRQALMDVLGLQNADRRVLQEDGADLDRRTNGRWLLEYLQQYMETRDRFVVDAIRTRRQAIPVLEGIVGARLVFLDVQRPTREKRFALSAVSDPVKASMGLAEALRHETEAQVDALRPLADLVVESDDLSVEATVTEVLRGLHLH